MIKKENKTIRTEHFYIKDFAVNTAESENFIENTYSGIVLTKEINADLLNQISDYFDFISGQIGIKRKETEYFEGNYYNCYELEIIQKVEK